MKNNSFFLQMSRTLLISLSILLSSNLFSQRLKYDWVETITNSVHNTLVSTIDNSNNIIIAGNFINSFSIADTTIFAINDSSHPYFLRNKNMFIAKFSSEGELIWVVNDSLGTCTGIVVDKDDNIYLSSSLANYATWDYVAGYRFILSKFDSNRDLVWSKTSNLQETNLPHINIINSMTIDSSGAIYIAGNYFNSMSFDGLTLTQNVDKRLLQFFIIKIDTNGNIKWGKSNYDIYDYNDTTYSSILKIISDNKGNLYITGWQYTDTVARNFQFGAEDSDIFLSKLDLEGNVQLNKVYPRFGGFNEGHSLALNDDGDLYLLLRYYEEITIDNYYFNTSMDNYTNALLVRYKNDTIYNITDIGHTNNGCPSLDLCVDKSENVYVTGLLRSHDIPDPKLIKVNKFGNVEWNYSICNSSSTDLNDYWSKDILIDSNDNVFISGRFSSKITLGDESFNPVGDFNYFIGEINTDEFISSVSQTVIKNFTVYPTITSRYLTIEPKTGINTFNMTFFNSVGELIQTSTDKCKLDISHLKSGIYFIEINYSYGKEMFKIIKN